MRQKYRIWDNQENKWFAPTFEAHKGHVEELLITPSGEFIMRTLNHQYENVLSHESLFPDRFETVWFTGLKDKNGKEIYEGDILKTKHGVHAVVYDKYQFALDGFYCSSNDVPGDYFSEQGWDEVIGNIYESPELLQQPTG